MQSQAQFSISAGWTDQARRLLSPHCDERPGREPPSLLVIHNISLPPGLYGGGYIEKFFLAQLPIEEDPYFENIAQLRVSAHCLIARDGNLTQFVSFNERAWHAGDSEFCGREKCNDYSIGIELEGTDEEPYTRRQYLVLIELTKTLMMHYPGITKDRIVGHSDIAPERKTDPGPSFDWKIYKNGLTANA